MTNPLPQSAALSANLPVGQTMIAACPSCGQNAIFTFVGIQEWPERVASLLKMKAQTNLWHCNRCQTTLSGNTFHE